MIALRNRRFVRRALKGHGATASDAPPDFSRDLSPAPLARENHTVTRLLGERLNEEDIAEVQRRAAEHPELPAIDPADPSHWALVLSYGMWFAVPGLAEKTRLPVVQPPEEVHAMARGPLAAAGGVYEADMVVDALASAGVEMNEIRSGLDF